MTDLTSNNHDLMKLVRARIEAQYPMAFIARELACDTKDLVHWILDVYRAPKNKPYINRESPAVAYSTDPRAVWSAPLAARQFSAWRRAQSGAAATLRMLEAAGK